MSMSIYYLTFEFQFYHFLVNIMYIYQLHHSSLLLIPCQVMYVTATLPYVFMFILLIRNCTLDGSADGIDFYLRANMTKLSELTVCPDMPSGGP